jgi:hypothetical protein
VAEMALQIRIRKLAAAVLAGTLGCFAVPTPPAIAQSSGERVQLAQGFFERLFGPLPGGGPVFGPEPPKPVDASRAPAPRKPDTPPTTTIVVLGDSMADWLAYGLEEALAESNPEYGVIRKTRIGSGLVRYDARNETQEWAHAVRELLANEKPNYIVMMIGLNDRQSIRVREQAGRGKAQPAEKPQAEEQDQENPDQPSLIAPERNRAVSAPGIYEFHSDKWEEIYTKRIDDVIAVLKSKNVPVFWVGLPSLRTQKATSEASYLNELFRARAEKAGIVYVDIWDGFVDDQGRFTLQGPDFEGQNRRLRASDGIHFTKPGARKLAHYVEREIERVAPMTSEPVALPGVEPLQKQSGIPGAPTPGGPTARPLTGPAVPLAAFAYARNTDELAGSPNNLKKEEPPTQAAAEALQKGDTLPVPAGRADDFAWPRRGIAAVGTDPAVTATTMPVPLAQLPPPPPAAETPGKVAAARPSGAGPAAPRPIAPQPPRPSFNPFSFFPFFR